MKTIEFLKANGKDFNKKTDRNSRALVALLRHTAPASGITVHVGGWVKVDDVLQQFESLTLQDLIHIVNVEPKQRLALSESLDMIRANQGHSFPVDLQYAEAVPPEFLLHGTKSHFVASIMEQGISKQSRHAVHLTAEESVAVQVGGRSVASSSVVLIVNAGAMYRDGFSFTKTPNDVWLTNHVPPKYIKIATSNP